MHSEINLTVRSIKTKLINFLATAEMADSLNEYFSNGNYETEIDSLNANETAILAQKLFGSSNHRSYEAVDDNTIRVSGEFEEAEDFNVEIDEKLLNDFIEKMEKEGDEMD